ncbi:tryptophan 7-halogenase [Asticcacaulis sp. SL142]|uniref:tryptophan halogenase family protein n=1 Tax=Asticcacaulis sp. SL142 TaxID=2995155 RepID=UPI00226C6B10|nr:tryptophan halogenase family protein [Asticcacaulis sp. SL142]WAC49851.1 tryptophan 7-halogenase [Asticcacaulis sp. SL142]
MQNPINKLIIAGGGTAGWMTAAALSVALPKSVEILLIESEDIGTVGVGEATIPTIRKFNEHLGLNEGEFIRSTEATFKLGIEFLGWGRKDSRYFHGFGDYGADHQAISAYSLWRRLRAEGDDTPLEAWSLPAALAYANRFFPPNPDPRSPMHDYTYAYHFDAGLFAKFLRSHAEARGVKRLNAKITEVVLRPEDGFIDGLRLDNGAVEYADFFMDCSGFRGLLIEGALKAGFTDWSHYLPVDRAWAVPCQTRGELTPYTRSTAHEAGWQWRIPLQHRTGNGHVFASNFIDQDKALDTLMANLDGMPLKDPMLIRFKTGHRTKIWDKNCLSLGLASGFLEPLESTSINLVQTGITRFLDLYPGRDCDPGLIHEYNRQMTLGYERVRDFIILHYRLNERQDGELWKYCAHMPIPDELQQKIDIFSRRGHVVMFEEDHFARPSWQAVFNGQGVISQTYDGLTDRLPLDELRQLMRGRRDAIARVVPQVPLHSTFIAQHCPSQNFMAAS